MNERQAHNILKQFKEGDIVDITLRGVVVHNRVDENFDTNQKSNHCITEIDVYMYDWEKPIGVDTIDMTNFKGEHTKVISVVKAVSSVDKSTE